MLSLGAYTKVVAIALTMLRTLKLRPARSLLVGVSTGFHLFLVGPLYVYLHDSVTFGPVLSELLVHLFPLATIMSLAFSVLLAGFDSRGYVRVWAVLVGLGLYLYLQFYYFVWDYGIFDGGEIDWGRNTLFGVLEVGLLALLVALALRYTAPFTRIAVMTLAVLFVGQCCAVLQQYRLYESSTSGVTGNFSQHLETVNQLSSSANVIIILIDTLQSDVFQELIQERRDLTEALSGFVYFPNSSGSFPYTDLSVHAVLRGEAYRPVETIDAYRARTSRSRLPAQIAAQDGLVARLTPGNIVEYLSGSVEAARRRIAEVADVAAFRQAPHFLKPTVFNDHAFLLRGLFAEEDGPHRVQRDINPHFQFDV